MDFFVAIFIFSFFFWNFLDFFRIFFLRFFGIPTKVSTKSYQCYYWTTKMGPNIIISSFLALCPPKKRKPLDHWFTTGSLVHWFTGSLAHICVLTLTLDIVFYHKIVETLREAIKNRLSFGHCSKGGGGLTRIQKFWGSFVFP